MEMGRREFNITLTDDEDPGYTEMSFDDFHDFMVADLAATIKDISDYVGGVPTVEIGKTQVKVHSQPVYQDARERLEVIVDMCRRAQQAEPHLPQIDVLVPLLNVDGWSLTEVTLRTPLWLYDVQEWPLREVVSWHEELRCLETYLSM
jgi:hypothetical protein